MSEYFVAGGTYQTPMGQDRFNLVCPGPGEPPFVMINGVMPYFKMIWQDAHLYRVEQDYTLVLVAPSPEALQRGIKAPERVTPDANLLEKLFSAIRV
jgi:hypothetical protein